MKTRPLIPTQSPETLMDAPAFEQPAEPRIYYSQSLADARVIAAVNIAFCAVHVDKLLEENFSDDAEVEDQKEQIAIGMRQLLGHTIGFGQPSPLDEEMECTLCACGDTAKWLEENEYGWQADEVKVLVEDAGKAFATYLELRDADTETETPPTDPTNDDGLPGLPALDPSREFGYEEVNDEFSLQWSMQTAASAPLLAFLRLKLTTWFAQNKVDTTTSSIADDYDWPTVLAKFPGYQVVMSGKNYVDIAAKEQPDEDEVHPADLFRVRITQDYHFDPDYRDERFTRLRDRERKAIETAIVDAALEAKIILSPSTAPDAV